jgi:hypothetical protein
VTDDDDKGQTRRGTKEGTALADVERDVANAGAKAARVRVTRAFSVAVCSNGKHGADEVEDARRGRSARDYVALPANEYNLLDAENVSRADDGDAGGGDGFVVSAGRQRLLFLDVEPRGMIRVRTSEGGCVQELVSAEIVNLKPGDDRSAEVTKAINLSLKDLRLRNEVSAERDERSGEERIRCQIDVVGDFTEGVFARAGGRLNTILGWSLGAVMPWFLTQLASDYRAWSRDEPRVTENASLASVAAKIIAGSRGKLPEGVRECEIVEVDMA